MANGREEIRDPCRLFSSRGSVFEDGAVEIIDLAGGADRRLLAGYGPMLSFRSRPSPAVGASAT